MEPQIDYYAERMRQLNEAVDTTGYGPNLEYYHPLIDKVSPYYFHPPPPGYVDFSNFHPDPPDDDDILPGKSSRWADCRSPDSEQLHSSSCLVSKSSFRFANVYASYRALDRYLSKNGHTVYGGAAIRDKGYLFLFCKLKRVPEYYEQVLNDKGVIWRWRSKSYLEISHMINITKSMPESLVIAKKIVAENDLQLDIKDMMSCLGDVCSESLWQQRLLGQKKNEEFLLEFWEKNKRKPSDSEISETFCTGWAWADPKGVTRKKNKRKPSDSEILETFCTGWTWADPKGVTRKFCTVSTCANPGRGRLCVGLTQHAMKELGRDFLEWLEEVGTTQEGLMIIEDNHKKRLKEPHRCRANSIKAKLQEAYRTGLAKEIEQLNQAFKDLMIPELDSDKVDLDTSVGLPVRSDVLSA